MNIQPIGIVRVMEKILTVNEVAEILSVKPITVREMFREKRLRAFKVGKAWRTTESMLREDIESLARGALSESPEAVATPSGEDSTMAKSNRPAGKPAEAAAGKRGAARGDERGTKEEGVSEAVAEQDTTHEKWMARPEDRKGERVTGADSTRDDVPPVPAATVLMNRQTQISGAKQAESAIPAEPEAGEKKGRRKKKDVGDQEQFLFDELNEE